MRSAPICLLLLHKRDGLRQKVNSQRVTKIIKRVPRVIALPSRYLITDLINIIWSSITPSTSQEEFLLNGAIFN